MKRMPSSKPEFILCICIFLGLFIVFSSSANATEKKRTLSQNPLVIYDDALSNDWELATNDSRTNESLMHPNIVQSGSYSIQLEVIEDWGTFNLKPKNGALQFNDYKTLRFWIYTDNRIQLKLKDGAGEYTALEVTEFRNDIPLPENEWALIEVDLSLYSAVGTQFTELLWVGFGHTQPTFYLDQIELIKHEAVPQNTPTPTNTPTPEAVYTNSYQNGWSGSGEIAPGDTTSRLIIQDASQDPIDNDNTVIYIETTSTGSWRLFNLDVPGGSYAIPNGARLSFRLYPVSGNESGIPISLGIKTRNASGGYSPLMVLNLDNSGNNTPLGQWSNHEVELNLGPNHEVINQVAWQGTADESKRPIYYLDDIKIITPNASPTPTPSPAPTSMPNDNNEDVYIDRYKNSWSGDGGVGVTVLEPKADPTNSDNNTIYVETANEGAWQTFNLDVPNGSYNISTGAKLSFRLYAVSGNQPDTLVALKVKTRNLSGGYSPELVLNLDNSGSDIALREWTYHEVDLNLGPNHEVINQIAWQGAENHSKRPTYYLDDIKIINAGSINPTPTPINNNEYTISINTGKIFTRRSEVTLYFTAPDSTTHVKVSNDGGFSGSEWQPYSETVVWEIDKFLNFLLPRVVYARFKDADGSTTSVYSDDIILDVLAPWGNGRAIRENNKFKLMVEAEDDVSGIDQFRISSEGTFDESMWREFEQGVEIDLTNSSEYFLFMQLSDKAGNISEPIKVNILNNSIYLPLIAQKQDRR